jgi:hypothetical protein
MDLSIFKRAVRHSSKRLRTAHTTSQRAISLTDAPHAPIGRWTAAEGRLAAGACRPRRAGTQTLPRRPAGCGWPGACPNSRHARELASRPRAACFGTRGPWSGCGRRRSRRGAPPAHPLGRPMEAKQTPARARIKNLAPRSVAARAPARRAQTERQPSPPRRN